jgi:hypothetical protein
MAVSSDKSQRAVDLVALIALAARAEGFQVEIALAGDRPELVELARFEREGVEFTGTSTWPVSLPPALAVLRPGSMRVLVGDCLFPHEPSALIRPIASRSGGLALLQLLSAEDSNPPIGGARRLTDSETGATRDLVIDARSAARYRERLARLQTGLEAECRRSGARFATLAVESALDDLCRRHLVPIGLLTAA